MVDEEVKNIHHVRRNIVERYRWVTAAFRPICLPKHIFRLEVVVFSGPRKIIDLNVYLWIFTVWEVAGIFFPLSWYQVFPRVPDHKPAHSHYSEKRIDAIILVMVDEDVHGNNRNAECIGGLDFS